MPPKPHREHSKGLPSRGESVLVNFFYAQNVGHAIEALHHCLALHAANPRRRISLALNAAAPTELARLCPSVSETFAIDLPLVEPAATAAAALAALPDEWDWILDDPRRHQPIQLETFSGMRDYYATSDRLLRSRHERGMLGYEPPSRIAHAPLRLRLPAAIRRAAERQASGAGPTLALMPAGSAPRANYPSIASWELVLDALADALPGLRVLLIGRSARDERTSTSLGAAEHERLLAHPLAPLDLFDRPLVEQLAVVESADAFLAPHTGFGMAALAVGTPWLAISGGPWFEWYFNHVPFRSIIPDQTRYPCFSQFSPDAPAPDGDDGDRIPSMTRARIREDVDRIVAAARELIDGAVPYETCLRDYFRDLVSAHGGDSDRLWSFDGVHYDFLPEREG